MPTKNGQQLTEWDKGHRVGGLENSKIKKWENEGRK